QDEAAPLLDTADSDLLAVGECALSPEQAENLTQLRAELASILGSQHACPGDGNDDGLVDQSDLDEFERITVAEGWSGSSTYDFNHDGANDEQDLQIIEDDLGTTCW